VANANQFVGDYTNPILKPQAAEVIKKHGEISLAGGTYPTPSNQCWPSGVPYIFFQHGMQMLQRLLTVAHNFEFVNAVQRPESFLKQIQIGLAVVDQ